MQLVFPASFRKDGLLRLSELGFRSRSQGVCRSFHAGRQDGNAVGTPFNNPDNMAIDGNDNIYIIEDQAPDNSDIWQAVDVDGDGVAETMGRWLTHEVEGAEPTGLIFDPNTKRAVLNIQHPDSSNDALWQVTLGNCKGNLK